MQAYEGGRGVRPLATRERVTLSPVATAAVVLAMVARPQEGRAEDGQAGGGWSTWTGVSSVKSGFVAASEVVVGVVSAEPMVSGGRAAGQPRCV